MVDWDATGSMLQGFGTLLGVGAVVAAAMLGKSTFEGWRRQQVAGRKLFQAERILEATYKGRRALKRVRSPMMWGHELSAAEEEMKDNDDFLKQIGGKKKRIVTAQAYFNRLNATQEEQDALDQCLPMARAIFSEELEEAIESLRHQFWIVRVDVESYIDDNGSDADFTKQIRRGMYEIKPPAGEINKVTAAVDKAVETIERHCIPVLRG